MYVATLLHFHINKKSVALLSLKVSYYILAVAAVLYTAQLITLDDSILALNGYFIVNRYTVSIKLLLIFSALFVLINSECYLAERTQHHMEFAVVFTLSVLLMALLVSANHIFSAFLALVGFSLNLYVLIMFDASSAGSREAGIKYYYLSTFSSGLLLYGLFLLYTLTKQGQLDLIELALTTSENFSDLSLSQLQFAIILILLGFFFKMSAFPAHA
jgi:NADH-quinone oxidoreductase subunit N